MKGKLAWALAAVLLLCGCGGSGEGIEVTLRDEGGGLLVDDVYRYTLQVPEEWRYQTAVERQQEDDATMAAAGQETPAPNIELQKRVAYLAIPIQRGQPSGEGVQASVSYNVEVFITYTRIPGSFDTVVEETHGQMGQALELGSWDPERSDIGEMEPLLLDGVACYRNRMELKDKAQEKMDCVQVSYYIPLADDGVATFHLLVNDGDRELLEQLDAVMETLRWGGPQ